MSFSWFSPDSIWQQMAIVAAWLGVVVLSAEAIDRAGWAGAEAVRKVVHIGVGNIILLAWWLQMPLWSGVAASTLASAIALLSYRFAILPSINGVGRKSMGTFFYAVSFGVLIAVFWSLHQPQYAVIGVLVMTWGDGLAALIGQRFGRHLYKLWDVQKSWEGSFTMAIASYIVSSAVLWGVQGNIWQTWLVPIAVALIATLLEAFSKYGIDNLTVPVGSAAVAFGLNQASLGLPLLAIAHQPIEPFAGAVWLGRWLLTIGY
jgi:phytol kinase